MLPSSNPGKKLIILDEEGVWNRLRAGDHSALEYLYHTYGKDLFNFGMKLYGRNEWVQDTLQELFIDLWKQHQKLSAVTKIKTYLFKAFRYKLQRQYGKEKRWIYQVDFEKLSEMDVELPLENKLITAQLTKEQQYKIASAITKLPPRQREVLHLLFDEDLSYEEISQVMEINVRSVYTVAWKGIKSLRKAIIDFLFLLVTYHFLFFS